MKVADRSGRGPVYLDPHIKNVARANVERDTHGRQVKMDVGYDTPSRLIKPDIVAPGGDGLPYESPAPLQWLGIESYGITSARSPFGNLLGIPPNDPNALYTRVAGTSQATAVVTGLAALLLQLGRKHNAPLGSNPGQALRGLFRVAARELKTGSVTDYGHGYVTWPLLRATLSDFITKPEIREAIIIGPQLHLEE